jgi:hypothetical protein
MLINLLCQREKGLQLQYGTVYFKAKVAETCGFAKNKSALRNERKATEEKVRGFLPSTNMATHFMPSFLPRYFTPLVP